jgi:hypothetical protein
MQQRMPAAGMQLAAVQLPAGAARAPNQSAVAALQDEAFDISAHLPLVRLASIEAAGSTVPILSSTNQGSASRKMRKQRC